MSRSFKKNQEGEVSREQYFRSERRNSKQKNPPDAVDLAFQNWEENSETDWDEDGDYSTRLMGNF